MSCITKIGPPCAAMRLTVAAICGSKMAAGVAFELSNKRYAACVLDQSPHASLIGDAVFCDFIQATVQALVGQIDATKLMHHPFHRLRADLNDRLHVGIFTSHSSRHDPQHPTPHSATLKRLSDQIPCVQRFLRPAQIYRRRKTCI